jgi:hypothetical protein
MDSSGSYVVRPIDGGETRPIPGTLPGDDLIQWGADGNFIYVAALNDSSVQFFRVNLARQRREPWKRIEVTDRVGLIGIQQPAVHLTPDGKSYAYSYWKTLTELYLVEHLK